MKMERGYIRSVTFQNAHVTKPLAPAGRITSRGHRLVRAMEVLWVRVNRGLHSIRKLLFASWLSSLATRRSYLLGDIRRLVYFEDILGKSKTVMCGTNNAAQDWA